LIPEQSRRFYTRKKIPGEREKAGTETRNASANGKEKEAKSRQRKRVSGGISLRIEQSHTENKENYHMKKIR
jgi:hypothetical protein